MVKRTVASLALGLIFVSCNKSDDTVKDDKSLIILYRCTSGWVGLDENLKITADSICYSFSHKMAGKSYQTSIKTPKTQWDNLTKTFHLDTFKKIQDESCEMIYDIPVSRFSVSINDEFYSFYNGECDEYYLQMQDFFNLIFDQRTVFRNQI